jgi:hypothetical protein
MPHELGTGSIPGVLAVIVVVRMAGCQQILDVLEHQVRLAGPAGTHDGEDIPHALERTPANDASRQLWKRGGVQPVRDHRLEHGGVHECLPK